MEKRLEIGKIINSEQWTKIGKTIILSLNISGQQLIVQSTMTSHRATSQDLEFQPTFSLYEEIKLETDEAVIK